MMRLFFCALTLCLSSPAVADGFDVKGYGQGMSLPEAQATAKASNHELKVDAKASTARYKLATVIQGSEPVASLTFCDNKLKIASYTYASGEGRLPGLRRSRDDKCPLRLLMDTIEDDTFC
jgi:hypothetical protein